MTSANDRLPLDAATLTNLTELVDLLCDQMEREAPLHNVQVLLHICAAAAKGDTVEVRELQKETGLSSSALSRALGALSEWSYKGRPGLELVTVRPDYNDRRRKPMTLSEKGKALAVRMTSIVTGR